MNSWFPGKKLIEDEQRGLADLEAHNEVNAEYIRRDQRHLLMALKTELGGVKGVSLSFGAGCVAALAYRNRKHLSFLKELPWAKISNLAQEALVGDPMQYSETIADETNSVDRYSR